MPVDTIADLFDKRMSQENGGQRLIKFNATTMTYKRTRKDMVNGL